MYKGVCFTNLDEYKRCEWPTRFVAVPHVGDNVADRSGKELRVVRVTHAIAGGGVYLGGAPGETLGNNEPYLRIELHR